MDASQAWRQCSRHQKMPDIETHRHKSAETCIHTVTLAADYTTFNSFAIQERSKQQPEHTTYRHALEQLLQW